MHKKILGISSWDSFFLCFFLYGRKCPFLLNFSIGTLPYLVHNKTWERPWLERNRAVSQASLHSVHDWKHTWLRHSLPSLQTQVWLMAVAKAFSMPRKGIELVSFQTWKERKGSIMEYKLLFFSFNSLNYEHLDHFKEIHKFLLSSEMLDTFPLNITRQNISTCNFYFYFSNTDSARNLWSFQNK